MFSTRLPDHSTTNAVSRAVEAQRAGGVPFVDLTASNPTTVGLPYPDHLLAPLSRSARPSVRAAAARSGVGARGHRCRLRASRALVDARTCRALGEHERGVQLAVQAALRSRRLRARAAAQLSAVRTPHPARGGERDLVRARVSRPLGDRLRVDCGGTARHACRARRLAKQPDRLVRLGRGARAPVGDLSRAAAGRSLSTRCSRTIRSTPPAR